MLFDEQNLVELLKLWGTLSLNFKFLLQTVCCGFRDQETSTWERAISYWNLILLLLLDQAVKAATMAPSRARSWCWARRWLAADSTEDKHSVNLFVQALKCGLCLEIVLAMHDILKLLNVLGYLPSSCLENTCSGGWSTIIATIKRERRVSLWLKLSWVASF